MKIKFVVDIIDIGPNKTLASVQIRAKDILNAVKRLDVKFLFYQKGIAYDNIGKVISINKLGQYVIVGQKDLPQLKLQWKQL